MSSIDWDEFIGVGEAAKIRGCHRVNILKRIKEGTLPARKVAGRYLLKRADVEAPRKNPGRPKKKEGE